MAKKVNKRSNRYPIGFQRDAVERMKRHCFHPRRAMLTTIRRLRAISSTYASAAAASPACRPRVGHYPHRPLLGVIVVINGTGRQAQRSQVGIGRSTEPERQVA